MLDTLGFMQVYKQPLDIFFFHSWPENISESLNVQWAPLPFTGATAPLAYVYRGTNWEDYSVDLELHSSNPVIPQALTNQVTGQNVLGVLDLLRIQLQVAWCKSICLPDTGDLNQVAKNLRESLLGGKLSAENILQALRDSFKGAFDFLKKFVDTSKTYGLYSGRVFPPLIATQYGGFLRMYGFCKSVKIQYLPPFTPLTAFPHRAKVSLSFARFFPFNLPDRKSARAKLGFMM